MPQSTATYVLEVRPEAHRVVATSEQAPFGRLVVFGEIFQAAFLGRRVEGQIDPPGQALDDPVGLHPFAFVTELSFEYAAVRFFF